MENIRDLPGLRFAPTECELVGYYLQQKEQDRDFGQLIAQVELYEHDPWELRDMARPLPLPPVAGTSYFFSPRHRTGSRPKRVAKSGYWKATGTDREVKDKNNTCLGWRKTLVFYKGKAPNGGRTPWIMNEYRLKDEYKNKYTLCKIHRKSRGGGGACDKSSPATSPDAAKEEKDSPVSESDEGSPDIEMEEASTSAAAAAAAENEPGADRDHRKKGRQGFEERNNLMFSGFEDIEQHLNFSWPDAEEEFSWKTDK